MFSNKLKRPALALAVTAGLLAVAGPASASTWHEAARTGLKYETEVTDYVRLSTASDGHQGSPVSLVDKDLNQPDMTIREHQTQVNAAHENKAIDNLFNDLEGLPVTSAGADSTPKARSAVLPELDANANAFLPEVNDEALAGINYEPDYIEGTQ